MPFIVVALDEAREQEPVPEGEYDLRVVKSENRNSKKGNPITVVTIRIEDPNFPNAQLMSEVLNYPTAAHIPETKALFLRNINRFLHAFNIPGEAKGFNSDDIQGATASKVLLTQETGDDGVIRNKAIFPRVDEKPKSAGGKRK